jgi:hypothetical protein
MKRLRNGQAELVAAKYTHYAGSQRRMVNQIRTGTVSRQTFLNVLGRTYRSTNEYFRLITNHYIW